VVGAEAELVAVAEKLGAPVVMSPNGRGALSDEHDLAFNQLAGQQLWAEADVALVVGRRFSTPGLAWGRAGEVTVIRIDIDPTQIVKPRKAEVAMVTSAAIGLSRLDAALASLGPRRTDLWDGCAQIRDDVAAQLDGLAPLSGYNRAVRAALPRDGMLFADVTRFTVFSRFGMPFYQSRSFFMPGFQATLGWSYPAALGAKVGSPDRKVVAISGDGGFGFTMQEMATAVLHKIPVTVVVFDNQAYGNVKTIQANQFGGRHIAVDLASPDWVKMAEAFGMKGEKAESEAQLEEVLSRHLALDAPSLITVPVGEMPNVWSLVSRPPSAGKR
jgi:acetolactate synthase-1/2/3 large subunit